MLGQLRIAHPLALDYSGANVRGGRPALNTSYAVVGTSVGWVAVAGSGEGLRGLTLPQESAAEALAQLDTDIAGAEECASAFGDLPLRIQRYFEGERVSFADRLDLRGASPFQRGVWKATRSIPYGEVRSYAWVARQAGNVRACRAVGQAMARNRYPIVVPCHRVVAGDGSLGGFGGGIELKRRLLDMEASARC
jgi:methylated-DNA-[protein]-cysteine S-methyltransferase